MIEFYKNKSRELPRFFYRNFIDNVLHTNLSDQEIIDYFEKEINSKSNKDFFAFSWSLPDFFIKKFDKSIIKSFKQILKKKRDKRPQSLKNCIYPEVSDEFSIDPDFYKNVLSNRKILLNKNEKFFTIGSCFANNFANFLKTKKIQVINFSQFEDLNSLGSNYILFNYLTKNEAELLQTLKEDFEKLFPEINTNLRDKLVFQKINQIVNIKKIISTADNLILTLGNTIDFYYPNGNLMPKFLLLNSADANETRSLIAKKIKNLNSTIRLSSYSESQIYLKKIIQSIREINDNCKILITVSPVPINSIIGVMNPLDFSAIEIDCVSKSTLRSLLHETLISINDTKECVYYLPTYEIVKWIAPNTNLKVYGDDDASSRHVSSILLNSICDYIYANYFEKGND